MNNGSVTVQNAISNSNEYMIKDSVGITVGRLIVIDHQAEHKSCMVRVSYYRKENSDLLKNGLKIFLNKIFSSTPTNKVIFFAHEDINPIAFTEVGCDLEGILENCIIEEGEYKNNIIFGIDRIAFDIGNRTNIFRLKGNRVEVKVLTPEDSEAMLEYYVRNKKHLMPYEPSRDEIFYSIKTQKNILMESYKQFLNGLSINCGIFNEEGLIGKIQLSNIVMGVFRNCFVGYSMDVDHQGKGYMTEALRLIIDYAFNDMYMHRLEASTLTDNIKSQRVLLACGFEEIGISKKYLFINGVWRDHKIFSLINNNI